MIWELKNILTKYNCFVIDASAYIPKDKDKTVCHSIDEIDKVDIVNLRRYKSYIDLSQYIRSHKQVVNIVFESSKVANARDNIEKLKKRLVDNDDVVLVATSGTIETIENILGIKTVSIAVDKLPEVGFWTIMRARVTDWNV
jgi:hypothetical protein